MVADKMMSDSKSGPQSFKMLEEPRWYPDGVPLVYLSMHNTKQFVMPSACQ